MRQGQIWSTVTGTEFSLTRLGLVEASALTETRNKVDLNRSNRTFLKTRVKPEKLEKLEIFAQGSYGIDPVESPKL